MNAAAIDVKASARSLARSELRQGLESDCSNSFTGQFDILLFHGSDFREPRGAMDSSKGTAKCPLSSRTKRDFSPKRS